MGDDAQPPRRLEVRDLHVLRFGPPEQGPRLEACALFERPRRQKLDGLSRTDGQRRMVSGHLKILETTAKTAWGLGATKRLTSKRTWLLIRLAPVMAPVRRRMGNAGSQPAATVWAVLRSWLPARAHP